MEQRSAIKFAPAERRSKQSFRTPLSANSRYMLKEAYQIMTAEGHFGSWHERAGYTVMEPLKRVKAKGKR